MWETTRKKRKKMRKVKKKLRIILSIVLPIICITSVCLSFFLAQKDREDQKVMETEVVEKDTRRFQANYYANADETSPSAGQSTSYKGGAVFLEPNSNFSVLGGTIQNHTNTFGGAVYISSGATFTMNGGTITGCSATYGGAIYVEAGETCNIVAGTITGNTASYGPSIYAEAGAIVNISDDTVIDENSVEIVTNVKISTDTIAVGDPSEGLNMYYVDFGNYPQWYVGDTMNTTLEDWYSSNSPTSAKTYVIRTNTWEAYKYTDGEIYARGTSYPYSTSYKYLNGNTIKGSSAIAWFKVEPIRWIVLNYDEYTGGTAENMEIMSYLALTADIYFNASASDGNSWETSYIRTWLNGSFYTSAFSSAEKRLIATTSVGNNITGNYNRKTSNTAGTATEDKVYCLSYWDYYNSAGVFANTEKKRLCSPTDFALSNYCYKATNKSYVTATYPSGGTCNYWPRSAGSEGSYACLVNYGGSLGNYVDVTMNYYGVRPALRLSI